MIAEKHAKIGELVIGKPGKNGEKGDVILVRGLGSCVAVVLIDSISKIAALSHVALPEKVEAPTNMKDKKAYRMKGRYADTFIEEAKKLIKEAGGNISMLQAKITGGANMFADLVGKREKSLKLGERNVNAVKAQLKKHKIPIISEHILGDSSRTMFYDVDMGVMMITITTTNQVRRI